MHDFRFEDRPGSPFSGALINRDKEIEFTINGRKFTAFQGDTLLSALLANGCKNWRKGDGTTLPLNQITIADLTTREVGAKEEDFWCGDRLVRDGLALETEPTRGLLGKFTRSIKSGNETYLTTKGTHQRSPLELALAPSQSGDFVVIGGGIAGLQAALTAAMYNQKVTVFERSGRLGGMCDYYGQAEDEEAPHALIDRLSSQVRTNARIDVQLNCKVLDVRPDRVLVLSSEEVGNNSKRQSLYWTKFKHLVIAVGADYGDREPLRFQNTDFAHHVFRMAVDYGVKPFEQLSILTGGNSGYRLGQLLLEAGIKLEGIYDPRVEPTSRHIDFAKAVGVHMHFGQTPATLKAAPNGTVVEFGTTAFSEGKAAKRQFESLVISHAPRANTEFWVRSGGNCLMGEDGTICPASLHNQNIALVGAASGSMTQSACLAQTETLTCKILGQNDASSEPYIGLYKYESPAQPLIYLTRETTAQGIREKVDAPDFSPNPGQNALSEYLFERSPSGKSISQIQAVGAASVQPDSATHPSAKSLEQSLAARFDEPCIVELVPEGYLNLAVGQLIYDSDGINQDPIRCGIVVDIAGSFAAILEKRAFETGQKRFVRTRNGLFAATLGKHIEI